jgi:glycosyltransferase involved in cell wall biosynthesis
MVTVAAISLVKDEADIIEQTVTHMLGQVDRVIVADNGSTDGTHEILEQLPVELREDFDPAHHQAAKLTALARSCRGHYVLPFDADEVWYSLDGRKIKEVITEQRGYWRMTARIGEYVCTGNIMDGDPLERMVWRRDWSELLKVISRVDPRRLRIGEGAHTAWYDERGQGTTLDGHFAIRHYPYRSPEQFISKVRNGYNGRKLTNPGPDQSVHLMKWGRLLEAEGEEALEEYFWKHFWQAEPDGLTYDPALVMA